MGPCKYPNKTQWSGLIWQKYLLKVEGRSLKFFKNSTKNKTQKKYNFKHRLKSIPLKKKKKPEKCWCRFVSDSPNVQLLFFKGILRAIPRTLVICLASKKSHSEICPAYIFLAWCGEIHFNYFTMISHYFSYDITGKEQNISFHSPAVFAISCK